MVKSVIVKKEIIPTKREFPKLMMSPDEDYILLINDDESGTVVWSDYPPFPIGLHRNRWMLADFKDHDDNISLTNS